MAAPMSKDTLFQKLDELEINTHTVEHPEVFTVDQALLHVADIKGVFAKNLFLKDKKKALYLFSAPHDADVKLNDLAKQVGISGGLRFADPGVLLDTLGVTQGSVSIFCLINDTEHKVKLILHKRFLEAPEGESETRLYFHPLDNTASTGVTVEGLKAFLDYTGHKPIVFNGN